MEFGHRTFTALVIGFALAASGCAADVDPDSRSEPTAVGAPADNPKEFEMLMEVTCWNYSAWNMQTNCTEYRNMCVDSGDRVVSDTLRYRTCP